MPPSYTTSGDTIQPAFPGHYVPGQEQETVGAPQTLRTARCGSGNAALDVVQQPQVFEDLPTREHGDVPHRGDVAVGQIAVLDR